MLQENKIHGHDFETKNHLFLNNESSSEFFMTSPGQKAADSEYLPRESDLFLHLFQF